MEISFYFLQNKRFFETVYTPQIRIDYTYFIFTLHTYTVGYLVFCKVACR